MVKKKRKGRKKLSKKAVGIKYGFRSGLEKSLQEQLTKNNISFKYEEQKIHYLQPEKIRTYTPDFLLPKKDGTIMYIETKGRWVTEDRKKMGMIFDQGSELDIRFIFQYPNGKLRKGSKTTYAKYCDDRGWMWAKKEMPKEWIDEIDMTDKAKKTLAKIEDKISLIKENQ